MQVAEIDLRNPSSSQLPKSDISEIEDKKEENDLSLPINTTNEILDNIVKDIGENVCRLTEGIVGKLTKTYKYC